MKIHYLESRVRDQIAAGEVVERPSNIVKELLENSIDAGSTMIHIRLKDGGKTFLEVQDNGYGMSYDDAIIALERHTTSKILHIDDLYNTYTYGFRGEALAAISSVSKLTMHTKETHNDDGYGIIKTYGDDIEVYKTACLDGTMIRVEGLFHTVPARMKYLKKSNTELTECLKVIYQIALSRPHIQYTIEHNDTIIRVIKPHNTLLERIEDMLDIDKNNLLTVYNKTSDMVISGYISTSDTTLPDKKVHYITVNNRYIEDYKTIKTIEEAYKNSTALHKNYHPVICINIDIEPIMTDFNIHPKKLHIKFSDSYDVYKTLYDTIKSTLERVSKHPIYIPTPYVSVDNNTTNSATRAYKTYDSYPLLEPHSVFNTSLFVDKQSKYTLIGQVKNQFIIAEYDGGIAIFDQHALHEKIRFEALYRDIIAHKVIRQPLLIPHIIQIDTIHIPLINDIIYLLQSLEITIDKDNEQYMITEIPSTIAYIDPQEIVNNVIDMLDNDSINTSKQDNIIRSIAEKRACMGAIKFNERRTNTELQALLDDIDTLETGLLCPHGRPIGKHITMQELWKWCERDGVYSAM